MDMAQLATQNARVRSKSDWIELLTAADTRYSFVDATHRQGSNMWMLQVSWKG